MFDVHVLLVRVESAPGDGDKGRRALEVDRLVAARRAAAVVVEGALVPGLRPARVDRAGTPPEAGRGREARWCELTT